MTQWIFLKIGGPLIPYWCPGFENSIESSLRSTISHVEIAQNLWNDIRDRFSLVNGPRIQ